AAAGYAQPASLPFPIRGLHMAAPKPDEVPLCVRFIRDALPKEGVNVLVMEFDYRYQFTSHPEVADPDALSRADVQAIAAAARESGVRLIPLINLLGHQSWAQQTFGLLRAHPEFDETPGKYPNNQGIYCRSYCPLHPDLNKVVFDLVDELATACGADAVHVGMDEVFLIGTDDCPRCRGRNRAELFAQEVRTLRDHLAEAHREMWMWGDRLLDGYVTGLGEWEASQNGTAAAINDIPRDIVICDWHYDSAAPTAAYFAVQGFRVVAAPWRKSDVALGELELVRSVRAHAKDIIAPRLLGMLQTSWGSSAEFVNAYYGAPGAGKQSADAVTTFKALFSEIRKGGDAGGTGGAGSSNNRPGATGGF
ncbi:MAG TPA: family 20 glycosylhydrolase, partial [Terriglobia bacterium]|nr:family 20 glycosylhydrolase [Terriglobia bacterium]